MEQKTSLVEAVVTSVIGGGERAYAVTRLKAPFSESGLPVNTTVTFSISAYQDDHAPSKGQMVYLMGIEKFAKGWRARSAQPIRAK